MTDKAIGDAALAQIQAGSAGASDEATLAGLLLLTRVWRLRLLLTCAAGTA